jgi:hypothetical protein
MSKPEQPTRRQFTLGLAAVVPLLAGAQTPAAAPKSEPRTATAALADLVQTRFGKHLTKEQRKSVRASIRHRVSAAERLRKVKLANADEPSFTFLADGP